jgi:hypothetical protein
MDLQAIGLLVEFKYTMYVCKNESDLILIYILIFRAVWNAESSLWF